MMRYSMKEKYSLVELKHEHHHLLEKDDDIH